MREHGGQIGKETGHAISDVDHTHFAGSAGTLLEFRDHRGVDPRGDHSGYRTQAMRGLELRSIQHDSLVFGPQNRVGHDDARVDDRAGMSQVDATFT
ncbi:hypothetical protein, partial [Microbacterium sp.]|uniref:hypothetical protein n=1 Tax=Microbacterium sp. TaxID=51671 RepID=UPI003C70EFE4